MASDPTEEIRRAIIPFMPAELAARQAAGEVFWSTEELTAEFEVLGFLAPYVMVRRRSDRQRGTLMFTNSPRWYFGWQPE